ncbi:MAG: GDSL-type esterase/lipase family protein [Phycisphaerales bacterium]
MACALMVQAAHGQQPMSLNLEDAYAPVKAEMLAGGGSIVCLGDSLTFREHAFWENFRAIVQQQYGNGGFGYQAISAWTGAIDGSPSWVEGRINADTAPHWSLDGMWLMSNYWHRGAVTFQMQDRHVKFHYVVQPDGGSMTVIHPGVPGLSGNSLVGTIETAGQNDVGILEYNFQDWEYQQLRFYTQSTGNVVLLGAENLSDQPGPRIHRVANGGWGVDEFLRRNWTFDRQLQLLAPQLVIIMLGQNDVGWSPTQWRELMEQFIARVQTGVPGIKVVLVSSYDSGSVILPEFAAQLRDFAMQTGVGFIDLNASAGRYQFFQSNGLLDPDGLHFSTSGGQYVARLIFDALESGGASLLNAPCGDIDFNNDTGLFDPEDINDFLRVYSEGECSTGNCDPIDFNRDGGVFDPGDIDAFLRVYSEGPCSV